MATPPPGHRPGLPLPATNPHTFMITKCRWSIRRPDHDRIAVPNLFDTKPGQVGDRPLRDVGGLEESRRTLLSQAHGIEGRLKRPGGAVEEAHLAPTHHRVPLLDPEHFSQDRVRALHLNLWRRGGRGPPASRD